MLSIRKILYLQKAGVLEEHRGQVVEQLKAELPDMELCFADRAEDVPRGAEFDAVITPTLPWLPNALARLSRYGWIHFLSAGVDEIWEMDFEKDVLMTKSSGVHSNPMSEYAIGAMLYFAKQFGRFRELSARAEWQRTWLEELTNCQLTILGLGHVGRAVAERARTFGMSVAGTLHRVRELPEADRVMPLPDIMEELPRTDFLVVCLPLTRETKGLVDSSFLGRLKPGAVLIDISRGGIVRYGAVIKALNQGILKGAALDVFEHEPLPADSPLWRRNDILITPHVAGTTPFYLKRALSIFLENYRSYMAGKNLLTPVDAKAGY